VTIQATAVPACDLLLGVDIGTTSAKAALVGADGTLVATAQRAYPLHHVRPNWVEQNPQDWWRGACTSIKEVLASVRNAPSRVAGVAVSSQAPSLVVVDGRGMVIRPAMIWMDRRAEPEASALGDMFGFSEVVARTGNRPDAFFVAAKLRWLRNHEPETLAPDRRAMLSNGYIVFRLTGEPSMDRSHATLLQLRDVTEDTWLPELCEWCGIDPGQFPDPADAHSVAGTVTRRAAEESGLRIGTPVMVGTVDGTAAALEVGASHEGIAAEMTGTSTVVLFPTRTACPSNELITMEHALPGMWLLLGATVASGASLSWFLEEFGADTRRQAQRQHRDPFELLTEMAARVGPGSDGVTFLPYLMGERSPLWHANARGVIFGLSLSTTRAAVVRSILEGTAFALRHNVEVAAANGIALEEVRAVGGGAKSALWCEIKADVLGRELIVPDAAVGAAFGAALIAGVGMGLMEDLGQTSRRLFREAARYVPNQSNRARYDDGYALFCDLYQHVRDDFDRAARLVDAGSPRLGPG
jgi:xylulokinase